MAYLTSEGGSGKCKLLTAELEEHWTNILLEAYSLCDVPWLTLSLLYIISICLEFIYYYIMNSFHYIVFIISLFMMSLFPAYYL